MAALWKIGVLFAKTISKPLAKNLNKRAANEGMLRDLCERYGQLHHNIETRITLRIQGHRAVRIKKLTTVHVCLCRVCEWIQPIRGYRYLLIAPQQIFPYIIASA